MAKNYRDFLQFTIIDATEYAEMLPEVGLKEGSKTGLAVANPDSGDMFPYTGKKKITPAVVEEFLDEIMSGSVKPTRPNFMPGVPHDEL